ncbi:MAG: hypothetical protein WCG55_02030 [bacterium]
MENFNPANMDEPKKESTLRKIHKAAKSMLVSKLLNSSTLDKNLADNLYANRILEEELVAPNKSSSGFTPSLPEGTQIIEINGAHYAHIGDRMYFIRQYESGFDLVDNTNDFIPTDHHGRRENKRRAAFQKKYGLSTTSEEAPRNDFYRYDESTDDVDNWIIHNDDGQIKKNRLGKDATWWKKGEPYKGMEMRSLIKDAPHGRHLFAKQSALEASIGKPLDQHRELRGDVIQKEKIENGGLTITPTSEADLPNIEGLKSFTYNPLTKTMERGIFHNPDKSKDKKTDDDKIRELKSTIFDSLS